MTELAGGELCLPQRPHNQVGAARRRRSRRFYLLLFAVLTQSVATMTAVVAIPRVADDQP